jgi:hypothetical protein
MILAFLAAVTVEASRSSDHHDCSCCNASHKQDAPTCHSSAKKPCVCNFQLTQVYAPSVNLFLKLTFSGFLLYERKFSYFLQPTDDIFHPPKTPCFFA